MKKIISLCLAAVLLLLPAAGAFAAEENAGETAPPNEAISLLSDLNILSGMGQEAAADAVTRGEFAMMMARAMGANLPESGRRIFTDVLPENEASAGIEYLYDNSVMRGYGGAEFRPEADISVEEAVKVAVTAVGYAQKAELDGGWSAGYYSAARLCGLLSGVSGDRAAALTVADAAALLRNMLECDVFVVVTGYRDGEPILERAQGQLYMETVLGVYKYTGIAEAYDSTSLGGEDREYAGTVKIGGEEFELGGIDPVEFFGRRVDAYYRMNKQDTAELLHVTVRKDNRAVTAEYDMIASGTTKDQLVCFVNDRKQTFQISKDAQYLYNGKRLIVPADADLAPEYGSVTLISNDGDGIYDVVLIKEYQNVIAEKVLAADQMVTLKYDKGSLDFSDGSEIKAKFYLDGAATDFSSISAGSVLSVALSKNLSGDLLAEVLVSNNQVTGTAQSMLDSGGVRTVVLEDGSEYQFASEYLARLEENQQNTYAPELGEEGVFYIDSFGRLAAYTKSVSSKNYAYVIACAEMQSSLDSSAAVKLFTKDSEIVILDTAAKLKLNGVSISSAKLTGELKALSPDGSVNQLVIYKTNSENELTELQTAENKTKDAIGQPYYIASEDEFVLNHVKSGSLRFYKNMAEHLPFTFVDGKSIQFLIPADRTNEKEYSIATKLASTDVTLPAPIQIYDAGASGCIGAMVTNASNEGSYSDSCLINETFSTIDEEGANCSAFEFAGGQMATVASDAELVPDTWRSETTFQYFGGGADLTIKDLKRGDVIKYTTRNGKINKIKIVVRADNIGPLRIDGAYVQRSGNMIADVISVAENGRTALVKYYGNDGVGEIRYQTMLVNGTVYRYEIEEDRVYNSSTADLRPGDRILINSFWWSPRSVVIFR